MIHKNWIFRHIFTYLTTLWGCNDMLRHFQLKNAFSQHAFQGCQGQSLTLRKIVFFDLFLRIIEKNFCNLCEKMSQLRNPTLGSLKVFLGLL